MSHEHAAVLAAFATTEQMLRYRNAQMAAGKDDPGPAAALEAVRAGAAAPARTPARMATATDAAEAERNRLARAVADKLVEWCDVRKPAPTSDSVKELFRMLAKYEESLTGAKPTWEYAAAADRLRQSATPSAPPAGFVRGRGGRQFSLSEALAPVHLCGSVVVAPSGSSEIAKW